MRTRSTTTRLHELMPSGRPIYKINDISHRHRLKDRKRYTIQVQQHVRRKSIK